MAWQFIALGLAGVAVGVLSGLLGIGGGAQMVPLLRLVFGLDPLVTTGTSLLAIIPTSASGIVGHVRNRTAHVKVGVLIGVCGAISSPLGSFCASKAGGLAVMCAAAAMIVFTAFKMIRKALRQKPVPAKAGQKAGYSGEKAHQTQDAHRATPSAPANRAPFTTRNAVSIVLCGLAAGFASGFIGVGGGFIIVPILTLVFSYPMRDASGTSLVAVLILAVPGAVTHAALGEVAFAQGLALAVGAVPGAYLGAMLAKRINDRALRLFFGILLAVSGIALVANELL